MFTSTKYDQKKRERYVRQLAQRLLAEARPAHGQGWRLNELLAAFKVGQALNELMTPWWLNLEIHEIDLLFPWDENVVDAITEDMLRNGYGDDYPPIILFEDKVLDGKLRLEAARRACSYISIMPRFEFFDGEARSALEFAIQLNGRRQTFTERQRSAILLEMGVR